jgi:hypothetical protein
VVVPPAAAPRYGVSLGELAGGRRLLSDDLAMLEAVARTLARRIDLLRLARRAGAASRCGPAWSPGRPEPAC